MAAFRRLVYAAFCAGLLSGVLAGVAHQFTTVPLILEAETYERAAAATDAPESPIRRAAATFVADILSGIGFALLLAAGLTLRGGPVTWRDGLWWGLAGFATFTIAPGVGLPPELPGAAAAPLAARQLWWLATALSTGGALAILAFTRRAHYAVLAVLLIALPQAYGAPHPASFAAAAPAALAHRFAVAATLVSFLFWAMLGAAAGYFYRRFEPSAD